MSFCFFPCCGNTIDEEDRGFLDMPHDAEIPVRDRKQTDKPCFIILIMYFIFLVVSISVAAGQGDFRRLIHGYDSKGNICGFKNDPIEGIDGSGLDLRNKEFLLVKKLCTYGYTILEKTCWNERECVETCPNGYEASIIPQCTVDSRKDSQSLKPFFEMFVTHVSLCWREILALCFFSIFLSGLVLTLLRMFAKTFIKILLFVVAVGSFCFTVFTWAMYSKKSHIYVSEYDEDREELMKDRVFWMIAAQFVTVFTVLFFVMLYVLRNKLGLVAVLFEEGGKCIRDIPMMLLQPVLTHLVTIVFSSFVAIGIVCLLTSGKATLDEDGEVSFPINIYFQIISWLLLFLFLWLSQFFLACQNFVIAGSVSSWYFCRVKGKLIDPVWRSFTTVVKYHLGSAAFGSLLIALIKAFRYFVRMLQKRGGNNAMAYLLYTMLQCLLACIETFLRIISKSAYVMIVLFGEPFCKSARRAFACITADSSKVALLIGAQTFILIVVEMIITFLVTFAGAAVFMNMKGVEIVWIPLCVVFMLAFLCCHCFFSVYNMTIDTLILCFCVDHQMNNGLEKPYYMNENLMVFFNEEDKSNERAPGANTNDTNLLVMA